MRGTVWYLQWPQPGGAGRRRRRERVLTVFGRRALGFRSENIDSRAYAGTYFACRSETRSCGRFGPARLGSTVDRSNSTDVV